MVSVEYEVISVSPVPPCGLRIDYNGRRYEEGTEGALYGGEKVDLSCAQLRLSTPDESDLE